MDIQGQFVSVSFATKWLIDNKPKTKDLSVEGDHLVCDTTMNDGEAAEFYIVPTPYRRSSAR